MLVIFLKYIKITPTIGKMYASMLSGITSAQLKASNVPITVVITANKMVLHPFIINIFVPFGG